MEVNPSLTRTDLLMLVPLIILFTFSLLPLSIKTFFRKNKELPLAILGLLTSLGLFFSFITFGFYYLNKGSEDLLIFSNLLVFDNFSILGSLLILGLSFLSLPYILSHPNLNKDYYSEYIFLILSSILGMLVMCLSNELITTFVGLELMSMCLYMLICMSLEPKFSKEAAIKYFVLGSLASAVLLYGISMIYGSLVLFTEGQVTSHYSEILPLAGELLNKDRLFLMGSILVLVGFCFKVSIFPFHFWVPDVYGGAKTSLSLFMATSVKVASVLTFCKWINANLVASSQGLVWALQWSVVLTIFLGSFAALRQNGLKRLLAYSSITHSGFILAGVLAFAIQPNAVLSFKALYIYLLVYGLLSIASFGFINILENKSESELYISDLKGLYKKHPGHSLALALCFLGLAGIPPSMGFFSKLFLFYSITSAGMYWLLIWTLIASVVAVYYYLKPIIYMFFYEVEESRQGYQEAFKIIGIQNKVFFLLAYTSLLGALFLPFLF